MINAAEGAVIAAREAADSKARDVVVLDLRNFSFVTDFFIIGTGDSEIQVQYIARQVKEKLESAGLEYLRMEGYNEAQWVLLDFGDVVIHIFHKDVRSFYNLERLWGDAPLLDYDTPASAGV